MKKGKNRAVPLVFRVAANFALFGLFLLFALFYTKNGRSPLALQIATTESFTHYEEFEIPRAHGDPLMNDRVAISVRDSKVDFVVFYNSSPSERYPGYVGSKIGNDGLAVGHILMGSFNDRMELTGTRKAYEIQDGQVLQYPIRMHMSAEAYAKALAEIQEDPSLAGLKARIRKKRTRGR